jgi:hypothetical protein
MHLKTARPEKRQNIVTYNNKLIAKPEKRRLFFEGAFISNSGVTTVAI